MGRLLRFAIVLLLAESTMINFSVFARGMSSVAKAFEEHGVVPDVVPKAPASVIKVNFPSGVEVNLGNKLTPTQVRDVPTVSWDAEPDNYYVLAMTDPDAPSRKEPTLREWNHWLVGNIPGGNVTAGETLTQFIGSGPPQGTGFHRYVFLVYQQPGKLNFDEPRLTNESNENRDGFSIARFATKYNLGDPISGNFYQCQYED
ncbi:unnamed protein product [Euphydryas editha]|uniref:Phosphatidylethanolamine-binding protein n=1 Tax=Euphydryas editha TaxID=104508 RepID=A0AAU9U5D8_EUPED|nr:unnamed protein product [Euphydryas editha]